MKNNKGYSLTELLITIVILGIVMTGIAMIMRTSSISYSEGNAYVTMQSEAQIITNQIEELLVDATTYHGEGVVGSNKYYSVTSNGTRHNLLHDSANDKMYYSTGDTISNSLADWQLMAEYVDFFDIDGFVYDDTSPLYDNMVTVNIGLIKRGYAYSSSKDVYFRNAIENQDVQQIDSTSTPTPGASELTGTIVLDRYQILDLEKEYGIKPDTITFSKGFDDNYKFVTTSYDNNGIVSGRDKIYGACSYTTPADDGSTTTSQFITTNTTWNTTLNKDIDASYKAYIEGTTYSGQNVKYLVTTPVVTYHVNGAEGVVMLSYQNADAKIRDNWIMVDGIDFASMVDNPIGSDAKTLNYAMVFYKDHNDDQKYVRVSGTDTNQKLGTNGNGPSPAKPSNPISSSGTGVFLSGQQQGQMDFGLRIDPITGDLSILSGQVMSGVLDIATFNSDNVRLAILLNVPGTNNNTQVIDLPVYVQGSGLDMSTTASGSTYTADISDWGLSW